MPAHYVSCCGSFPISSLIWLCCRKEAKQAKAPAQNGAKKPAEAAAWSAPAAQPPAGQGMQQMGADSTLREKTPMEEVTDMAYEAAGHTQNFAEEIEDQVRPIILASLPISQMGVYRYLHFMVGSIEP